jgi:[ribosomal protein S5]-alanine N-acetyltransferase
MQREYETERLTLKILDSSSADLVLDYYVRNKTFLEEWEILRSDDFYTKEYHEEQLRNDLLSMGNGNLLRFWIFKKNADNKVIGSVGLNNIVRGAFLSCHLGYKLDKDEINNGYATEAIKKGIEIIFDEFNLHRIEANIIPKNIRSLRVVEKLGFYNEGMAYKYLKINGKWEDHIHMVLLNANV